MNGVEGNGVGMNGVEMSAAGMSERRIMDLAMLMEQFPILTYSWTVYPGESFPDKVRNYILFYGAPSLTYHLRNYIIEMWGNMNQGLAYDVYMLLSKYYQYSKVDLQVGIKIITALLRYRKSQAGRILMPSEWLLRSEEYPNRLDSIEIDILRTAFPSEGFRLNISHAHLLLAVLADLPTFYFTEDPLTLLLTLPAQITLLIQ